MIRTIALSLIVSAAILSSNPAHAAARHPVEVTGVVNLNTATDAQLRMLPGIGTKKAQRIEDARAKHKFESTEQLMSVKGFGRITYRKLKAHLAVSGANTIVRPPKSAAPVQPKPDAPAAETKAIN